jgi:hypothetical protein
MKMLQEDQKKPSSELPFSLFPTTPEVKRENGKRRVLIVSENCRNYNSNSKISWNIVKVLAKCKDLDITHFAINSNINVTADHRQYPANVKYYVEKNKVDSELPRIVETDKPDVVIFFHQIDIIADYIKILPENSFSSFKTFIYIDFIYHNVSHIEFLNKYADTIFVNSEFYKKKLIDNNVIKPVHLLRVGFDRALMPRLERRGARAKINLPDSGFTILSPCDNTANNRFI